VGSHSLTPLAGHLRRSAASSTPSLRPSIAHHKCTRNASQFPTVICFNRHAINQLLKKPKEAIKVMFFAYKDLDSSINSCLPSASMPQEYQTDFILLPPHRYWKICVLLMFIPRSHPSSSRRCPLVIYLSCSSFLPVQTVFLFSPKSPIDTSYHPGNLVSIFPIISAINNSSLCVRVGLQGNFLNYRWGICSVA
jgi:hypothetical protein